MSGIAVKLLQKFANYIATEKGAIRAAFVLFGIPTASFSCWLLHD